MNATPLTEPQPPDLSASPATDGPGGWRVTGEWTVLSMRDRYEELRQRVAQAVSDPSTPAAWDLRALDRLDSAGALTLWQGWGQQRPASVAWTPAQQALFEQFSGALPAPARPARAGTARRGWERLMPLGAALVGFFAHAMAVTELAGRLLLDLLAALRQPRQMGWREISANVFRTGAQALGITALVGFLVGLTLSYLISRELRDYGADIFVVEILGIAIFRELGPLLAAIIVAGRSGSSMTAQLGVMRVTQELDALSVMGISHTQRLVLPKVLALALALPLVVLWTCALMLLGGMVAARSQLGLDPGQFLRGLPGAVPPSNLWLGWAKGALFGALIALLACHFGLRVRPNTESLGEGVTQSVVISITLVIVVDAAFALLFSNVGI
jgi:phospholipid/cholesterol/gamma-HCH transport system permease protein